MMMMMGYDDDDDDSDDGDHHDDNDDYDDIRGEDNNDDEKRESHWHDSTYNSDTIELTSGVSIATSYHPHCTSSILDTPITILGINS